MQFINLESDEFCLKPIPALFLFLVFNIGIFAAPGNIDTSFGSGGIARGYFYSGVSGNFMPYNSIAFDSAIQADDKIVAVGSFYKTDSSSGNNYDIGVHRFNANGTPDLTFGYNGSVVTTYQTNGTNSDEEARAVAIQPDGKIVVCGYVVKVFPYSGALRYFALVRYNPNGSLDSTFGSGGKVNTDVSIGSYSASNATCRGLAIQPDGKIVAAGYANFTSGIGPGHVLVRYNPNGSLDSTFANGGKTFGIIGSRYSSFGYKIGIQSNGEIAVSGTGFYDINTRKYDFSLARFNPNGGYFDSVTATNFPDGFNTADDYAVALAVRPDDKIILAGYTDGAFAYSGAYRNYALARYNSGGTLDTTFGNNGTIKTAVGSNTSAAYGVTLQPDEKIIAAGYSVVLRSAGYSGSSDAFSIARYNSNGTLDASFGSGGKVITDISLYSDAIYSVKTQSDGKITAVGTSFDQSGYQTFTVVRYEN